MNDCSDQCDLAAICSQRHWSIYWIIIWCSFVFVTGRILTVGGGPNDDSPLMSANDRSRWATIRALGDDGTYVIDDIIADKSSNVYWDSIDKVRHVGRDGQFHFYSSKPALLPTMLAYFYGNIKAVTGYNLKDDTTGLVRLMLLLVNGIPWFVYLWLMGLTLEMIQIRDWTRYWIVAAAGFATFLSTFTVTLNNHLPAAICVMATIWALVKIIQRGERSWWLFFLTGLVASFAVANELPALSFFAITSLLCGYFSPVKTATGFLPAVVIVLAAFFGTNFSAHQSYRPPYAHQGDGAHVLTVSGNFRASLDSGRVPPEIMSGLASYQWIAPQVSTAAWPSPNTPNVKRWTVTDLNTNLFTIVTEGESGSFHVYLADNWYDYPQSYWRKDNPTKSILDTGQASRSVYAFHVLFGHHGIFSLTPIWLFSLAGMIALLFAPKLQLRWLAISGLVVSLVVLGFYIQMPQHQRNYGGSTSAFRWAFWMAPIWLICLAPIVDWLGKRRLGRAVCFGMLAISALSALYSAENPWTHPWLYEIWDSTGLPK